MVLHIGAVPDLDAVAVAADDSTVPDGNLVPELDLTHDRGGGGNEGIAGDARALVEEVGDLAVSRPCCWRRRGKEGVRRR